MKTRINPSYTSGSVVKAAKPVHALSCSWPVPN